MRETYLVDFYLGWLIEVSQSGEQFKSVCYSPCRETFSLPKAYSSEFAAISAAKQIIDRYKACHTLTQILRDLYENNQLTFEDWRSLQQSLTEATKIF
ncbi:hypothetical protein [Egbenema bharatensis]|uniref:hypothetical protein n=1 Tax=Egbenema bharatensis TaxID=3463334 RepID=UPI003A88C6BD